MADKFSLERASNAPPPMPKINVPPRRVLTALDPAISPSPWLRRSEIAGNEVDKTGARGIRWSVRFTLGLIVLLIITNAALALLLGNTQPGEAWSLGGVSGDRLSDLSPAAGESAPVPLVSERKGGVTIYAPGEDRKALLEKLDQMPPPSLISRPAVTSTQPASIGQ